MHHLRQLSQLRGKIRNKAWTGPGQEGTVRHERLLSEWNELKEKMEAALTRPITPQDLELQLRTADCRTVAFELPENAAFVEFIRFSRLDFKAVAAQRQSRWKSFHYAAFVLCARQPDSVHLIDLGEAEPIERLISDFLTSLGRPGERRRRFRPESSPGTRTGSSGWSGLTLRAAVFDPLKAALGGRTRVLLAPDGDLTCLPFEALPTDDGRYLLDDYTFSYLSSGRDVLQFSVEAMVPASDPVVIANPEFDLASKNMRSGGSSLGELRESSSQVEPFHRLAGTRIEGEQIGALLGVRLWLGAGVLKKRLKACRSPRILHLATHSCFLPDWVSEPNRTGREKSNLERQAEKGLERLFSPAQVNPWLRSGLALAGCNTSFRGGSLPAKAEDGLLTAEDICELELLATELVVLSLHHSAPQELPHAEGVPSLERAFLLAGAKTLVLNRNSVPEVQTRELMEEFYRLLLTGRTCADSLREAQLALKLKYPHPLYWSGFVCCGPTTHRLLFSDNASFTTRRH
jgi:CHAT domain-containing protein